MILLKQAYLCVLPLVLGGCIFLAVEESDVEVQATSIEEPAIEEPAIEEPAIEEPDVDKQADSLVEIAFMESAPKDRFVITNRGSCMLEELTIEVDLSQSAGGLIFDTSSTGAGVEVFQPFEVETGDIILISDEGVNDGDRELVLRIAGLSPGDQASFTIDVDDTLPRGELGQIRVADSEINGAIATITVGDSNVTSATFSDGSIARVNLPACPSRP
ncbi:MAG: hypothetical protein AAGD25_40470 [Cyanobacteria bacterium P01_F01_bin.150]